MTFFGFTIVFFRQVDSEGVFKVCNVFYPANMIEPVLFSLLISIQLGLL